jgi:hypothetical protein
MFEYHASPDGPFRLADALDDAGREKAAFPREVQCLTCGTCYELLERLSATGQPVARKQAEGRMQKAVGRTLNCEF